MKTTDLTEKDALKVTWLGLLANLFLALAKGFIGFIANSSALIADAGHSVSDLLSDGDHALGGTHVRNSERQKSSLRTRKI